MAALTVALTATSNAYGFHRDELYFRMLRPAWGYVDQPPLTPLVARAFSRIADEPWALRIPATLATLVTVLVLVLITRELGGGRPAQALCAWGLAFAALPLIMGHALVTAAIDMPVWPAVLLFAMRAQLRRRPQWWLAAGLVVGLSMYNKLLVAVLLVALAVGLALVGPLGTLLSRWTWGGMALALLVGGPNLLFQATQGWPQLSMGRALAENNADEVRVLVVPFLVAMLGPPLVPIWTAGVVGLARRPAWRPIRFVAAAFPVLVVLVIVMGAQFYYPFGLLAVLYAAGCVVVESWLVRWRRAVVAAAVALNAAVSVVLGLPVIPVSALGETPVPDVNPIAADSVGWPRYVAQIGDVYASLPASDRGRTVIVTSNYGEAGAVDRFGGAHELPTVYSGHNELYFAARPPDSANVVVYVGAQVRGVRTLFDSCREVSALDNEVGVENEEQGQPIAVCRDPIGGWSAVWPALKHLD